ncbi:MAG: hypothetical protein IJN48_04310 [Clostridia bacterium]|nr:hypothetical protein [Clostridia bacterium]
MKNNQKRSDDTFYSKRSIALLITAVVIITIIGLAGMYALGIISMPQFISDIFNKSESTAVGSVIGNIAAQDEEKIYYEALPREEYANAIADISIPNEYYQSYTITLFAGDTKRVTDYIAIYKDDDWWVQTSENEVILSTVICKDGRVKIADNADNTSILDESGEINYAEYFGYTPLSSLTSMIYALASGEAVEYAGGVSDFSLSFTQARGTGENIFSFNFTRADGIKEEYTFAFESATILSAAKYSSSGEKIYQMEMKDSQSNVDNIDIDTLLVID